MNRGLFLAILSMDSYNRGYGRSVKFSPNDTAANKNEVGVQIGNATIAKQDNSENAITAGFYALSYDWNGETVVMYRGSDFVGGYISDIVAYFQGAGSPYTTQARLAIEFYNAATGRDPASMTNANGPVIVSGHSLGGGLAGYVGKLTGTEMVLFDPMPFDLAADNLYQHAVDGGRRTSDGDGGSFVRAFTADEKKVIDAVYGGTIAEGYQPWVPTKANGVSGAYIPAAAGKPWTNSLDSTRLGGSATTSTDGLTRLNFPEDTPLTVTLQNKVGQRHANTLIVMTMFGKELADQNWRLSAKYWIPQLFDQTVGAAAGGKDIDGVGNDPAGAMQNAIAYSAIGYADPDGTLVFGKEFRGQYT